MRGHGHNEIDNYERDRCGRAGQSQGGVARQPSSPAAARCLGPGGFKRQHIPRGHRRRFAFRYACAGRGGRLIHLRGRQVVDSRGRGLAGI